jgi:hypothetical protein
MYLRCTLHANPSVSFRRDQLIPLNHVVRKKEQLGKGLEEEEKKTKLANYFFERRLVSLCYLGASLGQLSG